VSTFDNLDARIYRANDELNKIEEEQWTSRIITEDGKTFYNHFKED
jgi:3'-5' exoribonuclease